MNILFYDDRNIKMPDPLDSDEDENDRGENNDYNHYISIGQDQKIKKGRMIDIYVSMITSFKHKIIINLNEHEHMRNLMQKIKDNIEQKYDHLRGLNGLQVKDLKKVTGIDLNKGAATVSRALKNPLCSVPIRGRVSNALKANDHLICDIESHDMWIKYKIIIETQQSLVDSEMEVKFDKNTKGDIFQNITQKLVLQIWNQYWQDQKLNLDTQGPEALQENEQTNFVLTDFRIISIDVGVALALEDDLDTSLSTISTVSGKPSNYVQQVSLKKQQTNKIPANLQSIPKEKSVGEVINYQNNLVKVKCFFTNVKDLFLSQNQGSFASSGAQQQPTGRESIKPIPMRKDASIKFLATSPKNNLLVSSRYNDKRHTRMLGGPDIIPDRMRLLSSADQKQIIQPDRSISNMNEMQQYHVLDTDQSDNYSPFNDEEIITEQESNVETDGMNTRSQKHKFEQLKIPVRVSSSISYMKPVTNETIKRLSINVKTGRVIEEQKSQDSVPDFSGNIQQAQKLLFAIIMGNIVLPKKNPILIEEPQLSENFTSDESSQDQISNNLNKKTSHRNKSMMITNEINMPYSPPFEDGSQNAILLSNSKQRQSNSIYNMKLAAITEDDKEHNSHSTKGKLTFISGEDSSGKFNQLMSENSRKLSEESEQVRKTTHLSTPDEVQKRMKLARLTAINDDANMDFDELEGSAQEKGLLKDSNLLGQMKKLPLEDNQMIMIEEELDLTQPLMGDARGNNDSNSRLQTTQSPHSSIKSNNSGGNKIQHGNTFTDRKKKLDQGSGNQSPTLGVAHRSTMMQLITLTSNTQSITDKSMKNAAGTTTKKGLFSNFFNKLKRGAEGQKNLDKPQSDVVEQNFTEFEILQRVILPSWLLTHEEYHLVEIPPVRNFIINERERGFNQAHRDTMILFQHSNTEVEQPTEDPINQAHSTRKKVILIIVALILVTLFGLGIYFAITLSLAK